MTPKDLTIRAVGLILIGLALFQLIASLIGLLVWLLTGDWRDMVAQIALLAISLTLPLGYMIWKKYCEEKISS